MAKAEKQKVTAPMSVTCGPPIVFVRYGSLLQTREPITPPERTLSLPSASVLLYLLTQLCLKLRYPIIPHLTYLKYTIIFGLIIDPVSWCAKIHAETSWWKRNEMEWKYMEGEIELAISNVQGVTHKLLWFVFRFLCLVKSSETFILSLKEGLQLRLVSQS